ncbi:MAG: hypothetical protein ACN4GM_06210 [Gammaproteobacteria bacterium]
MNKQLAILIVTLFIFPLGSVWAQTDINQASQPPLASNTKQAPATSTNIKKDSTPEKAVESINGAFGIQLGEHFKPSMVASVLSEKQHTYRVTEGVNQKGNIYQVKPSKPDEHFQDYSIKTTKDGIIYAIKGSYQYEVEPAQGKKMGKVKNAKVVRSTCKATVKKLAEELETHYGKPRGKGWNGEWFSFNQSSEASNKNLKLYANRCRTGLYSIVYTDKNAQRGAQSGQPGMPLTGN